MSAIIRPACAADVEECLRLSHAFYATTNYGEDVAPMDDDTVRDLIRHCTAQGVMLVAQWEGTGLLIGMVALVLCPYTFNRSVTMAAEVAWYVEPWHERNGVGLKLEAAARDACVKAGAAVLNMYALETSPQHVHDYYARTGYRPAERSYRKRL